VPSKGARAGVDESSCEASATLCSHRRAKCYAGFVNTKIFLSTWLLAGLLSLGTAGGCGQAAATCDTVCALPNAPVGGTCVSQCSAEQQSLAAAGASGDFQAYLTCLANADDFNASTGVCSTETATVMKDTDLGLGGVSPGTTGTVDSGSLDAGGPTPVVTGPCDLGDSCEAGATCTNPGAGPCGSDQRLSCDPSALVLVADGFPCTGAANTACGWGSAGDPGCSETCSCADGLEVCTGDCPDAGASSP
jgi:hypothetical protein